MPDDPKPFRCRICDKLRERDSNHWWIVRSRTQRNLSRAGSVELLPWNSVIARRAGAAQVPGEGSLGTNLIVLVCGLNCLMTAAGRAAESLVSAISAPAVAQGAPAAVAGGPEALSESVAVSESVPSGESRE